MIIASGPSLTRADVARVEESGYDMMGINNAYMMTDKLKYHYGCDTKWWRHHWDSLKPGPARYSLKAKDDDEGVPGVMQMRKGRRDGLSLDWPILRHGGNSGYQAINLAVLLGYRQIILLGYDMQETNGRAHWHPDHKFPQSTNPATPTFKRWRKDYKTLAAECKKEGIEVLNATRQTALECFPLVRLEDMI